MSENFNEHENPWVGTDRACVQYAKSGRSSCKGCKEKIEKGEVRIGTGKGGPEGDPKYSGYGWLHPVGTCVNTDKIPAKIRRVNNYCAYGDYDSWPGMSVLTVGEAQSVVHALSAAAPNGSVVMAANPPAAKVEKPAKAEKPVKAPKAKAEKPVKAPKAKAEKPVKAPKAAKKVAAKAKKPVKVKAVAVLVAVNDAPRFTPRDRSKSNAYSRR
ncbi:hypothetical protein ScalyP_jg9691 [Parmales sp. scaly parma]|nr:hypothetical protein ScalyP_jg9691 [Parmales sp. scaly parma]